MIAQPNTLSLNIAGDGVSTSVDFDGSLFEGANRTIVAVFIQGASINSNVGGSPVVSITAVSLKHNIVTVTFSSPLANYDPTQNNVYGLVVPVLLAVS